MAKEELKQMINRVTVQGTLMDNGIEVKVDSKGRRYLSGPIEVKVDNDYIIPIDTFAYEMKSNGETITINGLGTTSITSFELQKTTTFTLSGNVEIISCNIINKYIIHILLSVFFALFTLSISTSPKLASISI